MRSVHHAPRCGVPALPITRSAFEFTPVSGRGTVRSWTVVRQAFLPGFDEDLPFVLVDVELVEQSRSPADRPVAGRRHADLHIGDAVVVAFEDLAPGRGCSRFRARPVSGRFAASNKVAIVGYAHSQVRPPRRSPTRGAGRRNSPRRNRRRGLARRADRRLRQLEPVTDRGGQGAEDGVSIVSSTWLAQHLGAAPRYVAGFDGIGQIPGSVAIAVNAVASGAADYVLFHRALHNPVGRYHANPMREVRGCSNGQRRRGFSARWP